MQTFASHLTFRRYGFLVYWSACILLLVTPSISFSQDQDGFSPYIERHENGWIDWDNGLIYGIGKGYLAQNSYSHARARMAADLIASGNIIKLAAGINLNDQMTLEALGKKHVSVQLRAFIQNKQHSQELIHQGEAGEAHYRIVKVASLKGISGLTSRLVNALKSTSWHEIPIKSNSNKLEDEDDPWLIIDARKFNLSKLEPALFPKIKNNNGETVYSVEMVNENALNQRGMARYVISDRIRGDLGVSIRNSDDLLAFIDKFIAANEAHAASEKKKRRKRREYVVVKAQDVEGLTKTNLVISESDAQRIKKEDASAQILKKCRVVIVTSNPVGGIEGMLKGRLLAVAELMRAQKSNLLAELGLPGKPLP